MIASRNVWFNFKNFQAWLFFFPFRIFWHRSKWTILSKSLGATFSSEQSFFDRKIRNQSSVLKISFHEKVVWSLMALLCTFDKKSFGESCFLKLGYGIKNKVVICSIKGPEKLVNTCETCERKSLILVHEVKRLFLPILSGTCLRLFEICVTSNMIVNKQDKPILKSPIFHPQIAICHCLYAVYRRMH